MQQTVAVQSLLPGDQDRVGQTQSTAEILFNQPVTVTQFSVVGPDGETLNGAFQLVTLLPNGEDSKPIGATWSNSGGAMTAAGVYQATVAGFNRQGQTVAVTWQWQVIEGVTSLPEATLKTIYLPLISRQSNTAVIRAVALAEMPTSNDAVTVQEASQSQQIFLPMIVR